MQITDWNKRWAENKIGFHEQQPNQYLTQAIKQFKLTANATIFVPLCGKSNDLKWLADQGYKVVGIECSTIAVKDFFKQHHLIASTSTIDNLTVYHSGNITIYQGDFFNLNKSHLEHCDLIYDRASMVAFTKEQRTAYINHLNTWFDENTQMLLITLFYEQTIMSGPPFSVTNDEVNHFYTHKKIKALTVNDVIDEGPRWRKVGLTSLIETAFHIN